MKKVLCIAIATLAAASVASAKVTPYASIHGGVAMPQDIDWKNSGGSGSEGFDTGYSIEGALGAAFEDVSARAEVAIGYQQNDFEDSSEDMSILTMMLNGYYDIKIDAPVTPYVLAGIGLASIEVDSEDDQVFAGQIGAGIGYEVSEGVFLDLQYKYYMTEDATIDDTDVEKIGGHLIQVGGRFEF